MNALLQDLRYAVRGLVRSPGFTTATVLTLAIGTGANATVFSFVDALLLRGAPAVRDPASLYSVFTSDYSSGPYGASSYPDYLSIKEQATAFESLSAFSETTAVLTGEGIAERVRVAAASGGFFDVLALRPAHGRLLGHADAASDNRVAVISHDLWRRVFGADPRVIGRGVTLNGNPFTVVGVTPRGFDGLNLGAAVDAWTPLAGSEADGAARGSRGLWIVGRLRAGHSVASAQAQLDTIAARLARAYPETNLGTLGRPNEPRPMVVLRHTRIHPSFRGTVALLSATLMMAVALVLLIACANVAGLLLSRGAARRNELTIRMALGASRRRLLQYLLVESLLLGVAGGTCGVLLALWTSDVLPSYFPAEQARLLDASVDARVLVFTAAISVVAGALFGLVPGLQVTRPAAQQVLRAEGERGSERRTSFVRFGLVASQVALTFVLVVSCGLLVRSLFNALRADLGFGAREAVVASTELPGGQFTVEQGRSAFQRALNRVRTLPGVEAASLARMLPLAGTSRRSFTMEGYQPRSGEDTELNYNIVDEHYFETLHIPIVAGRAFSAHDDETAARVAIVNEAFADRYFGGRAVGRRIRDSAGTLEIVGVARTVKHRSIEEEPLPVVFYPFAQSYEPRMSVIARTSGNAAALADTVRRAIQESERSAAVFRVTTLRAHVAEALAAERLSAALVSAAGAMALALAVVGIYGVISYGVVRRRREIGVRVALGARPREVVRLVLAEGLVVTLLGIVLGVLAALGATELLASMLFGVHPRDALIFVATAGLLAGVALLAGWAPARRAARLDPVQVLRQE